MNFKRFPPRNKNVNVVTPEAVSSNQENGVVCDTSELAKLITKWTKNEGWKYKDFATFAELIGVRTPIKLSDWDKKNSFKCVSAINTEVTISLLFGDHFDYCSEIWVTEGAETRKYAINGNFDRTRGPKATIYGRTIKRNGKELNSYYFGDFCRILTLDKTHKLEVQISEPNGRSFKNPDARVLKNCQQIDEYLLERDNSLVITEVYDRVMTLLGFSDEDISNSEQILFSYIETIGEEEKIRSTIYMVKGEMQEYAVLEYGETFHVLRDGSWKYLSDDTTIVYLKEQNKYVLSSIKVDSCITNTRIAETFKRVTKKISKMLDWIA